MKKISNLFVMVFLPGIILFSCSKKVAPGGASKDSKPEGIVLATPPCIIYKTKSDYSRNIPVTLSDDKSSIVSYPDIKDIYYKGKLAYPATLDDGFLLDNRGIGPDVAFLSYTYEEYKNLSKTPSSGELMKRILDRDPLLEMYQCGTRYQYSDIEKELNEIIKSGKLNTCKKIK